jgi:hypothetical protein
MVGIVDRVLRRLGLRPPYETRDREATYRIKGGRVLTDADIQALADEAERGYDVDALRNITAMPDDGSDDPEARKRMLENT